MLYSLSSTFEYLLLSSLRFCWTCYMDLTTWYDVCSLVVDSHCLGLPMQWSIKQELSRDYLIHSSVQAKLMKTCFVNTDPTVSGSWRTTRHSPAHIYQPLALFLAMFSAVWFSKSNEDILCQNAEFRLGLINWIALLFKACRGAVISKAKEVWASQHLTKASPPQ